MANQKRYESVHRTIDIVFRDVPVTVEYIHHPGWEGTEFEPPEYEWIEIDRVMVDEINIYNLIGDRAFNDLVEAVDKEVTKLKEEQ